MLTAFILIDCAQNQIASVAKAIANLPNIAEVYSVTGDHDLIAIVRLTQYDDLASVVPEGISAIPGVTNTNTVLAFRRYAAADLEAAWDIGLS